MLEYAGTASTVGGAGATGFGTDQLEAYAPYVGGAAVVLLVLFFALRR